MRNTPRTIPWHQSLRFKLVAAAITVELIMLSALLANSFRLLHNAIESQSQIRLEAITPLLDAALAGRVFQRDHTEIASILKRLTSTELTGIDYIAVFDQFGNTITSSGRLTSDSLPQQDNSVVEALTDLSYDVHMPLTILDSDVGSVYFGLSLASMVDIKDKVIREGFIIAGVEILLSLLLLASGGYLITRHINLLAEGSRRIAEGDYTSNITISGKDEIALLAEDFNFMATAISKHISDLRTSEMRTQAIFDAVGDAIFIHDVTTGKILDVNQRMCEMYKCTRDEAIGNEVGAFSANLHPYTTEGALDKIKAALNGTPQIYEWQARAFDGHIFWVEISLRLAVIGDKNRLIAVVRDINERKNAATEKEVLTHKLHQAHKMETIGLMAGGVAHDLNNILSGIVGYPELMLRKLPEDSELREPITEILESGKRAAAVVADLLTVARGAATTRDVHDLNLLVQEYLTSPEFKKLKSLFPAVTSSHHLDATESDINCSSVNIKKCIMNLVTNAFEAIVDHGSVIVSTRNQSIDETSTGNPKMEPGEYVILSVQDNGPGIADNDLEHIFEPFYTKKEMGRSGTGLGLAVVWNTVDDHKGNISVESSDKGTCFHLYFPISKGKRAVQAKESTHARLMGNNEYILVVDDEPQLRDIASKILEILHYRVDAVNSGEQAVEFVKNNSVDLVLLDMLMEPGMNGRETYEQILKVRPEQKAIIASGFSESEDVKSTLRLGAHGFINKPYTIDQLGNAVKDALKIC